jgi:hypothetical protein
MVPIFGGLPRRHNPLANKGLGQPLCRLWYLCRNLTPGKHGPKSSTTQSFASAPKPEPQGSRPAESQPTTGWHMKALVTLRPSAPACRRPRLLLLHGTSTATVTTTWNLPSNVATRLKLGMLTRRIGVGSSPVSPNAIDPFQMDLVYEKGARIEEAFDGLRRIGRQQTRKVFQEQLDVTEIVTPLIELVQ